MATTPARETVSVFFSMVKTPKETDFRKVPNRSPLRA